MTEKPFNSRETVFEGLTAILQKGQYSHIVIGQILNKYGYLEKKDRAFITRLIWGVLENLFLLDDIIDSHSKIKTEKMKAPVLIILRMGIYQIYFMDGVKNFAAVNESVNLAKAHGLKNLSGFINGVLRSAERDFKNYRLPKDISLRYSIPKWLTKYWTLTYGAQKTEEIIKGFADGGDYGVTVRLNLSKGKSRAEILNGLLLEGVSYEETSLEDAVILTEFDSISDIGLFNEGYITVQDISSMLAVYAAAPKKGDTVIDVCAAPGGKSLHIADILCNTGHVFARDKSEYKAGLITENILRTGFENISVCVWDALEPDVAMYEKADIVIADLPCSGLGVLKKKPDIRYRIKQEDILSLAALQRNILSVVWKYVKKGGILIYSTCTIDREENEDNVKWFVQNFPFKHEEIKINEKFGMYTGINGDDCAKKSMLQIFPSKNTDGFFIAKLKRID